MRRAREDDLTGLTLHLRPVPGVWQVEGGEAKRATSATIALLLFRPPALPTVSCTVRADALSSNGSLLSRSCGREGWVLTLSSHIQLRNMQRACT